MLVTKLTFLSFPYRFTALKKQVSQFEINFQYIFNVFTIVDNFFVLLNNPHR